MSLFKGLAHVTLGAVGSVSAGGSGCSRGEGSFLPFRETCLCSEAFLMEARTLRRETSFIQHLPAQMAARSEKLYVYTCI